MVASFSLRSLPPLGHVSSKPRLILCWPSQPGGNQGLLGALVLVKAAQGRPEAQASQGTRRVLWGLPFSQ